MPLDFDAIVKEKGGIQLDIGCGDSLQPGFVGMDIRPLPHVDIVHDIEVFPWPIPDEVCTRIVMSHVWEHVQPRNRLRLMEELWRISKPYCLLLISAPYATSYGANQDPTHYPCPNQHTFTYFDPSQPLWFIYKPSPWRLHANVWNCNGNMEVAMYKRPTNWQEIENPAPKEPTA